MSINVISSPDFTVQSQQHGSRRSSVWSGDRKKLGFKRAVANTRNRQFTTSGVVHRRRTIADLWHLEWSNIGGRWSFRGIDWTVMVVGVLLLRARRPHNSLPGSLRDPALSLSIFRRHLKAHFFAKYWWDVLSALEISFMRMRCINLHFTYLLTN